MKQIILDTETTGNLFDEPVEISFMNSENTIEFEQHFLKPSIPCLPCTVVVHSYDAKFLSKFPPIETELEKATKFLFDNIDKYILIGYNIKFDINVISNVTKKFLNKPYEPKYTLDLCQLARKLISIDQVGNHTLDTIYYFLFPDKLNQLLKIRSSHSALQDIHLTNDVFSGLKKLTNTKKNKECTIQEIIDFTKEPILLDYWPFGKHKGKKIEEVLKYDRQYVEWFLYKADFKHEWPDLLFTLQQKQKTCV